MAELSWSRAHSHCALCGRPFAKGPQERRHEDRECAVPCWCEAFCWVNQGGVCTTEEGDRRLAGLDDELAMALEIRALDQHIARLKEVSRG